MRTLRKYNEPYNRGTITPYAGGSRTYFQSPVVSNIQVSPINATDVTITWTTDIPSDSKILFGLDTQYGSIVYNNNYVISHSVQLTGLTTATLYHYQLQSQANNTQIAKSVDATFTTA